MKKWYREASSKALVKRASFTDGEISLLLLGAASDDTFKCLSENYDRFVELYEISRKSLVFLGISFLFAMISYLNMIKSFETNGMAFDEKYLDVVALLMLSGSLFFYISDQVKLSFFKEIYSKYYISREPKDRVLCLMAFPLAFEVSDFSPIVRGFPRHLFPLKLHQTSVWIWTTLIGVLLMASLVGFIFIGLIIDVWNNISIDWWISKFSIFISCYLVILAIFMPRNSSRSRTYLHYGLTQLLSNLSSKNPNRHLLRQQEVLAARIRMGLIEIKSDHEP